MVYKIEIQRPDKWEFMKKMDGKDVEYKDKKEALNFILAVKDCFCYKIELKEEQNDKRDILIFQHSIEGCLRLNDTHDNKKYFEIINRGE